jgi:hypothetical protein
LIVLFVLIPAHYRVIAIKLWVVIMLNLIHAGISSVILIPRISQPGRNCNSICTYQR